MLRSRRKRYPIMVVWQFATIAALIGALLTYVMVLTNRLGTTNVLLKRIEEGLVRPQPVTENASVAITQALAAANPVVESAPQAPAAAELAEDEASASEVADRDRRVSYLTVRDLKVISRSGRRSSDTPGHVSPLFNEVFGRKHEQAQAAVPHVDAVAAEEPVVAGVESHEAVVEELAVATYEIQDFLEATPALEMTVAEQEPVAYEPMSAEPTSAEPVDQAPAEAPGAAVAESDAVDAAALEEKRRRDLLMHAQRRRRRLR